MQNSFVTIFRIFCSWIFTIFQAKTKLKPNPKLYRSSLLHFVKYVQHNSYSDDLVFFTDFLNWWYIYMSSFRIFTVFSLTLSFSLHQLKPRIHQVMTMSSYHLEGSNLLLFPLAKRKVEIKKALWCIARLRARRGNQMQLRIPICLHWLELQSVQELFSWNANRS